MGDTRQRHQHGVHKHLVEGIGGALTGAALVVLLRGLFQRRGAFASAASVSRFAPTDHRQSSGEST